MFIQRFDLLFRPVINVTLQHSFSSTHASSQHSHMFHNPVSQIQLSVQYGLPCINHVSSSFLHCIIMITQFLGQAAKLFTSCCSNAGGKFTFVSHVLAIHLGGTSTGINNLISTPHLCYTLPLPIYHNHIKPL